MLLEFFSGFPKICFKYLLKQSNFFFSFVRCCVCSVCVCVCVLVAQSCAALCDPVGFRVLIFTQPPWSRVRGEIQMLPPGQTELPQTRAQRAAVLGDILRLKELLLVSQSCRTLCNSIDCSPPGSSVHGISHH